MKQGFELYFRAITQLFFNLWAAIRATVPAWVALTIITSLAAYLIVGDSATPAEGGDAPNGFALPPYFWTYFMIAQCLTFMALGYIGPRLHRAILTDNTSDSELPYREYLFGLMQLGLIALGLGFIASRVISVISSTLPGPLTSLAIPVICLLSILYVILRISVILPAISLGRPSSLRKAWISTNPFRYSLALSLVLLVLTVAGLHSLALVLQSQPWLSLTVGTIASWFALMIMLSYLNVIYREARRQESRMARQT